MTFSVPSDNGKPYFTPSQSASNCIVQGSQVDYSSSIKSKEDKICIHIMQNPESLLYR